MRTSGLQSPPNITKVNFLDITLDFQSGKHHPYIKEGNIPLYLCSQEIQSSTIYTKNYPGIHKQAPFRNSPFPTINTCNCHDKGSCPMEGKFNKRNVIYQAKVRTSHSRESYIVLCNTSFKSREKKPHMFL